MPSILSHPSRFACVAAMLSCCASLASGAFPTLALKPVVLNQIQAPTTITHAGDGSGRLFVCEQRGQIRIIHNGMLLPAPFLDLSSLIIPLAPNYDERGLLGLAFHPGYADGMSAGHGKFYVFYSAPSPNQAGNPDPVNCRSTITEFQVSANDANIADPASKRIVLEFDKPQGNHNGGQLAFDADGLLHIGVGDGGGANDNNYGHTGGSSGNPSGVKGNAQDTTKLLGKILRIDPLVNTGPGGQYGIPADNPLVGAGGGVREEIFAFGLRNPWRFSFDVTGPGGAGTDRLFCADVGQNSVEEVNIITKGGNYGWRIKEGTFDFDATAPSGGGPLIPPIAQYAHPSVTIGSPALPKVGISITGGFVYRGSAIAGLQGKYIFGDYNGNQTSNTTTAAGVLMGLEETVPDTWAFSVLGVTATRILAFGRDEQGELYIATEVIRGPRDDPGTALPTGAIYKIVAGQTATVTLAPTKDNSMFSELPTNSAGVGDLFVARTGQGNFRRALVAFDVVGQVPANSLVTTAQASLYENLSGSTGAVNVSFHRLTEDWGEGTSDPSGLGSGGGGGIGASATNGDATWTLTSYNASSPGSSPLWTNPGGTYDAVASATTSVPYLFKYFDWRSPLMAADVLGWSGDPATNFGWIVIGKEDGTAATGRRFYGREAEAIYRPKLQITWAPPPQPTRFESWLTSHFPTIFTGQFVGDVDGDGIENQIEYAYGLSPTAFDASDDFSTALAPAAADATDFTVTFRRDTAATDLTYMLQTSSNLADWTTIAQSTAGGAAVGQNDGVIVSDVILSGTVNLVTVRQTLPAGSNEKKFVRLQVDRQ